LIVHLVTRAVKRRTSNVEYFNFSFDYCPVLFRQVEVIFRKGVLGIVSATDHAPPAVDAPGASGSLPAEEWIINPDPRLPEEDSHIRWAECVPCTALLRHGLHHPVCLPHRASTLLWRNAA
jgi:hypothetical protein